MYPCVFPFKRETISVGDQLFFEHYGSTSDMAYGKKEYLEAQQECLSCYEEILTSVKGNIDSFCQICYIMYPPFEEIRKADWLISHRIKCKPYMSNYFLPNPQAVPFEQVVEII